MEYQLMGNKGPLIVLENGLGNTLYGWYDLVKAMAEDCRILLYHRKGYGRSENYKTARTVAQIV